MSNEINWDDSSPEELVDAIDGASDQDTITYLTDATGKRICAIVPVDVAEAHEASLANLLTCKPCREGRHRDCPRHHRSTEQEGRGCKCDQRNIHQNIEVSQLLVHRLTRGH